MSIRTHVKLFAVIGDPIAHSLSPVLQNAAFGAARFPALYFGWRVRKRELAKAIRSIRAAELSGFNVTLPLKEAVMRHLDWVDPMARRIGAVNTVVRRGRKLLGYNTDTEGFLRSLKKDLGMRPAGRNTVLLGAGGAARAVGFALVHAGVRSLVIANRHPSRARILMRRLQKERAHVHLEVLSLGSAQLADRLRKAALVVNATRLGLKAQDPLPVRASWIHPQLAVLDLVYGRRVTPLVRAAKKRGSRAADGGGMLIAQGAAGFAIWTGRKASAGAMRQALKACAV